MKVEPLTLGLISTNHLQQQLKKLFTRTAIKREDEVQLFRKREDERQLLIKREDADGYKGGLQFTVTDTTIPNGTRKKN